MGRAIFTHCGSEIVRSDARAIAARIRKLGLDQGLDARVANDGLTLSLPGCSLQKLPDSLIPLNVKQMRPKRS